LPRDNTAARPAWPDVRLVRAPVFLLSSIRSGSTLLRCMLNSHPAIHAPHELHLRYLTAGMESEYTELAMATLGYGIGDLRRMLWDRVLHDQLRRSGKSVVVDKSPSNAFIADELRYCWPDARFIVLRRHPAAIVASIVNGGDGRDEATATAEVLRYGAALDAALDAERATPVVCYEDLVADPIGTCRRLCQFLDVDPDDSMVDYGRYDHGPFVYGIGDWGERIRSGRVLRDRANPAAVQEPLVDLCRRWGYQVCQAPVQP
jgi:hypothetical protein